MTHIPGEGCGKGDTPRPVDKKAFDYTWIRLFGDLCPDCKGCGASSSNDDPLDNICRTCCGIGKVDRKLPNERST